MVGRPSPLAYTVFQDNIILIYSGIEEYFPSKIRRKELLTLLKGEIDFMREGDILPSIHVNSGKLAVCGSRVIDWWIGKNVADPPCVIEEPPLKY